MIIKIIYIAAGGSLGSVMRFLTSYLLKTNITQIPLSTLFVNVSGSFLIGLLINFLESKNSSEILIKYFFVIGLLGSYTTFSTFSFEIIELLKNGKLIISTLYVAISISLSLFFAYLGYYYIKL
ncbi:MAG: putative fluoride ion transporter CrcB [Alphaproteobacteria bacterium MarineAlpha5_Bin9]|nr:MAG: putative fluoride ion transporter CrcB [Alphaproteobacteria bacterium MarineAlpha5_Bin9]